MHVRRLLTVALLTMATALPFAPPAAASCVLDERPVEARIEEASTVLVGTVTATRHADTTAEVEVEEIWKGAPNLRTVVVQGGSGQDGMATSLDRMFATGTTYLFLVQPEGSVFSDNACSATQEWTPALAAARPDDATMVEDGPSQDDEATTDQAADDTGGGLDALPVVLGIGALAAAATATWAARKRQRQTDPS